MVIRLSSDFIKTLHKIVLENDPQAASGFKQESMVEGSMQRALTKVYGYEPFQSVIDKAASLMFSIIVFHPFTDGNKRTSLLAVHFFLLFNGYQFTITEDVATLAIKIARGEIRKEETIAQWLKLHCRKNLLLKVYSKFIFPRVHTSLEKNESFLALIAHPFLDFTKGIWPKT